jgi:hypothetical protein
MVTTIQFVPGAVTAGQNIDLPSWAPKIDEVASAFIVRPTSQISIADHSTGDATHAACAATSAAYATATSLGTFVTGATHTITGADPVVSATPTKVNEDTITLDVDTQAGDILYLTYIPQGARLKVA